jgi:Protein of unknown function (DUF2752)
MSSARSFGVKELAAGVTGVALVAAAFAARALASATPQSVYFNGQELLWGCAIRQQFGIPCPACGLTRSVLLTLHGHLGAAVEVNPGGPLVVLGVALLAALMFALALPRRGTPAHAADGLVRRVVLGASAYGCLTTVVLLAHWVRALG